MCKKKQFKYCPSETDECMKKFIVMVNMYFKKGYKTVACCCGHGKYPKTLLVKKNSVVIEFFSGEIIPRKRNFYRKDKEGYYYIPEVSTPNFKTKTIRRKNGGAVIRRLKR